MTKKKDLWDEFGENPRTRKERVQEKVIEVGLPLTLQLDTWIGLNREQKTTTCIGLISVILSFMGIILFLIHGWNLLIFFMATAFFWAWVVVRSYYDIKKAVADAKGGVNG